MIDSSILDIGTSKWTEQCNDIITSMHNDEGHFLVPAVPNVNFIF